MRVMSLIFNWLIGLVFLLFAGLLLLSLSTASIPCVLLALIFLPPVRTWVHQKTGWSFPKKPRRIVIPVLIVSIIAVAAIEETKEDHKQAAIALQQKIDRYYEQKGEVVGSIKAAISREEYKTAIAHANRYAFAKDADLVALKRAAEQGYNDERRAQILTELKTVSASEYGKNKTLYSELIKLTPGNETYQSKYEHYAAKLAEREKTVATSKKAAEYIERIDRELKSLATFKIDSYLDTKDSIIIGVALFGAWAQIADEARKYQLSDAQKAKVARFKSKVARVQRRDFPKVRDAYGPAIRRQLWEHDMSARTFGGGFTIIEFVGGTFAANRNIKQWQISTSSLMRQLRFKQTRYKWYKEADEYTYYDIDTCNDGELVVWLDGGRYRKLQ